MLFKTLSNIVQITTLFEGVFIPGETVSAALKNAIFLAGCAGLVLPEAHAHKPSYANDHSTKDLAFEVEDPEISIVLYAEMTCTKQELWLHMDSTGFEQVWLELGVPQLDRLADYRPSLAIVAEGLPEADVPFDLPEGMGAEVIHTDDVVDPIPFNEPFTQTDSWILFRDWYDIPEGTDVYLVAYNPAEYTGKLWVAVGLVEDFSDVDMSEFGEWLDKTQAFHEIGDTEDHVELDCSQVYDGEDDGAYVTPDAEPSKSGCTVTPTPSGPLGLASALALFLGLARRRR